MVTVVVFDLDDTLYEEMSYVLSGFRAVAGHLSAKYGLGRSQVYMRMREVLQAHGRGAVFDEVLAEHRLASRARIRECLAVYRAHEPRLKLHADAVRCLSRLRSYPLYIVTDGNKLVQGRKVQALALDRRVSRVFITHRHGVANAKPSPYCFSLIAACEKRAPEEIMYVADDPSKDFVGLKPLGFRTARVLRGRHTHVKAGPSHEAELVWANLDPLTADLLDSL